VKQDYLKPSTIKFACIRTIPLLLFFCVVSVVARAETHDIPKAKSSDEPITAGDWNQAFFDAGHTGNNRYETLLNRHNVGNLTLLWASQVGDWPELNASPVISGGKVYIVSGGFDSSRMYAFDALTGATVWVGEEEGLEDLNSAAVGHGLVFASMDGIVAYDADTGEVVWHALDGQYVRASQTLKGNVLYVATFEGQLYALDAGTGNVLWSTPEECCVYDQALAVAGGRVFQVRTDATLTAHDARTGQRLWRKHHSISGSVSAARGKVFFPDNPTLFALDQATGNVVWSFRCLIQ
jgi:outer membrane protein assembly factor BamB